MKEYCIKVVAQMTGYAHIEAECEVEALKKAADLYENREIDWYEEKLASCEVEGIEEDAKS